MYLQAREVIDYLRALDVVERVSPQQGDEIGAFICERGGYTLFRLLDERPGQFDENYAIGNWHWKLRQARNDGRNHFFEFLNGRRP